MMFRQSILPSRPALDTEKTIDKYGLIKIICFQIRRSREWDLSYIQGTVLYLENVTKSQVKQPLRLNMEYHV